MFARHNLTPRRSERVRLTAPGTCKSSRGFSWDIRVDDLSEGGCRVDDPRHGLDLGSHVEITIAKTGPYIAEVAWRQGDRVGLEFIQAMDGQIFRLLASGQFEKAQKFAQGDGRSMQSCRYPVRRIM